MFKMNANSITYSMPRKALSPPHTDSDATITPRSSSSESEGPLTPPPTPVQRGGVFVWEAQDLVIIDTDDSGLNCCHIDMNNFIYSETSIYRASIYRVLRFTAPISILPNIAFTWKSTYILPLFRILFIVALHLPGNFAFPQEAR